MRRDVCMKWAESLSDNLLRIFAESDLLWEKIASIEYMGYQEVFDISIPGCANFIGNGILTHNCGQIEQDADIVAFIYREEMHNKDTDKKGIAELHIAKSRNGALGVIPMRFDGTLTKFSDLTYRTVNGY
jgi:replicative DNA helicase